MHKIVSYSMASKTLSLQEKVGQLFMPAAFINDSEEEIQTLEKLIKEQHIGSLCFFHSPASAATNFESATKVIPNTESFTVLKALIKRYQKASKTPLLISIDAEWGLAMRIENTPQYPYAITLGAIENETDLIFEVGKNIANDCKVAGIHWNLAPVIDVNNNPKNPVIGYRSFGNDKVDVTQKATYFLEGTKSEGILTSVKHFPGHGDTETDSHLDLPLIHKTKEELFQNELYPFIQLIKKGVDSVMIGHLNVPALSGGKQISSSISKEIITDLLRKELGYNGVIISDALNMHAVSKNYTTQGELEWLAFEAGNDVLCFAENPIEGIQLIVKNAAPEHIEKSFQRIWALKEKAFSNNTTNLTLSNAKNLNAKIAKNSICFYKGNATKIANFKQRSFIALSIGDTKNQTFFKELESIKIATNKDDVKNYDAVLLAIYPRKVKPKNNFDFTQKELDFIQQLVTTKNVVIYIFGNPYMLNVLNIEKANTVVLAHQNFDSFQQVAAAHFLGKIQAKGRLPFQTK